MIAIESSVPKRRRIKVRHVLIPLYTLLLMADLGAYFIYQALRRTAPGDPALAPYIHRLPDGSIHLDPAIIGDLCCPGDPAKAHGAAEMKRRKPGLTQRRNRIDGRGENARD